MATYSTPDQVHEDFTNWAKSQGVVINPGIAPAQFTDRGIGMISTKPLKVSRTRSFLHSLCDQRFKPTSFLVPKPSHQALPLPRRGGKKRRKHADSNRCGKKGDELVFVPAATLLTVESDFVKRLNLPANCSAHGRLAAALTLNALEKEQAFGLWHATWPTMTDLETMPFLWHKDVVQFLPPPAKG